MKARPNSRLAELVRHRLLAVADAEHRQPAIEEMLRRARAVVPHHRRRPTGQYDALRLQPLERLVGAVERGDLAIDPGLAHAPGNQLRHLASEVDDEDRVAKNLGHLDGHLGAHSGRKECAGALKGSPPKHNFDGTPLVRRIPVHSASA